MGVWVIVMKIAEDRSQPRNEAMMVGINARRDLVLAIEIKTVKISVIANMYALPGSSIIELLEGLR